MSSKIEVCVKDPLTKFNTYNRQRQKTNFDRVPLLLMNFNRIVFVIVQFREINFEENILHLNFRAEAIPHTIKPKFACKP